MTLRDALRRLFGSQMSVDWQPPDVDNLEDDEKTVTIEATAVPIHILAESAKIRCANGRLVIDRPDEEPLDRPLELVSALHIHGWANITSSCLTTLMRQGTPVVWRGANGYPISITQPLHQAGLEKRRKQYLAHENGHALIIARSLISAKILNMRGLARRKLEDISKSALKALETLKRKAQNAKNIENLMGFEGAASAKYFSLWPKMISSHTEGFEFSGRSKRPPQDAINAALSYSYAVLTGECQCAIAAEGLDLRLGFLHSTRAGRPALALDLAEPFRPLIADAAVLRGINLKQLKIEHFQQNENAVLMTESGRRTLLSLIEERLASSAKYTGSDTPHSYRTLISLQARALSQALLNDAAPTMMEMQ